jgi:hypothetical protein
MNESTSLSAAGPPQGANAPSGGSDPHAVGERGGTHVYGVIAEFATADALLAAVKHVRAAGYSDLEAYSPFHVEGLSDALGLPRSRVPLVTLLGALAGGVGAYFLQWYSAVIDYPVNIGGRPLHSWPMFVPTTFEVAVLGGALAAFIAVLVGGGLPRLHHPVFAVPDFRLAMRNHCFLCVRAGQPGFDAERAARVLRELEPIACREVRA